MLDIRRSSEIQGTSLAVLQVINNRGKGVFSEHDEDALVRLCACGESLLRRKAAEVSLLWSGMTERSLIRKSNTLGGTGGAWFNYARVESTMMRLYSGASFPADAVKLREKQKRGSHTLVGGREDHDGDGDGDRKSDQTFIPLSNGSHSKAGLVQVSEGGDGRRSSSHGSTASSGGIVRMLSEDSVEEESKLMDLSMNLFELSSEQLLSLVGKFFRTMGLMDTYQVRLYFVFVFRGPIPFGSIAFSSRVLPRTTRPARPRAVPICRSRKARAGSHPCGYD